MRCTGLGTNSAPSAKTLREVAGRLQRDLPGIMVVALMRLRQVRRRAEAPGPA